jgi:Prealbumin-like fold domain
MRSRFSSWLRPGRRLTLAVGTALVAGLAFAIVASGTSLPGSNFEIDNDANLKVDRASPPALDWANVNETRKSDVASGQNDDSFGNGTKEDTAVPSVVTGSIPPQKSDLLNFGVYLETTSTGARFLNLFWHRVQEPNGTTNMDFEFNQSSTLSANGKTPVRTAGDVLIQYDLAQGGTTPQLFVSRWVTSGATSQCEASNSLPCWSTKQDLTAAGDATGSINTSAIPAAQADGLGNISPRTFGEAQIDFDALTGGTGTCTSFGSAYLKSRSSDSFTAALKDFIAPTSTNLANCGRVIIRKQTNPEENPNTTNFGYTKSINTSPATPNTFTLQDDGSKEYTNVLQGTGYTVTEDVIPSGWDLQSINCSASTGVTPSISGATVTFAIDSAADVLDCTYTNRARGTIIVEKITDDGQGAFDFTSGTLTPSPFTLTTTGSGTAGKASRTFSDLAPGTYDVDETVPAGWNLVGTPSCDDGSSVGSIGLSAGETVTCTFHDARERGAIQIEKRSTKGTNPLVSNAGAVFSYSGPSGSGTVTDNGAGDEDQTIGVVCVSGLLAGNYTVNETTPPSGYGSASQTDQVAAAADGTNCGANKPTGSGVVTFTNPPLADIQVNFRDGGSGETSADSISCDNTGTTADTTPASGWDDSVTHENIEVNPSPRTVTCTIVIDP